MLALGLALACAVVTGLVASAHGPRRIELWEWARAWLALSGYGLVVSLAVRRLRRQPEVIRAALRDAPVPMLLQLGAIAVMASFTEYKVVMQQVQPFWADALLSRADWIMHLGHHPWELIPLHPAVTHFLNAVYLSFFALLFVALTGWAWLGTGTERARVYTAYVLCWLLLGTVMATLLSSAGPVYLERLGVSDAYVPLTRYLHGFDIEVINSQEALWLGYAGEVRPGGISAMPSLHVAIPALFTLTVWRWRALRVAGIALTLLTLAATVHLGWHYALDGYVSIAGAVLVWWLAGVLVRRWSATGGGRPAGP